MGEMLDLDKMTGIPARLKKQTWQPWTSAFQCTNKRSWPRGCLSRNHRNNHMSHALVAYFIVNVSSTYALESESGKREVFIYSDSHFVVGLVFSLDSFKKKRRDASWGGEVHCVAHAPSSSTSNGFHWKKWSNQHVLSHNFFHPKFVRWRRPRVDSWTYVGFQRHTSIHFLSALVARQGQKPICVVRSLVAHNFER